MSIAVVNTLPSSFGECKRNQLKSIWDILFEDHTKEWISFKPTLGAYVYPCYACRHLFSSFFSLQDHVNRRIIVLKYKCAGCSDGLLTFYNRCALLLHARAHFSLVEGRINLSEINTYTLPVRLAGFLPVPDIPRIYQREEESLVDDTYINVQFYSPSADQKGKQIVVLNPDDFTFKDNNVSLVLRQICKNIPKCTFVTIDEQKRLKEQALLNNDSRNELATDIKVELFDYVDQFTLPVITKVESLHEKTYNLPRCLECNSIQKDTMVQHYQGNNRPTNVRLKCDVCKFVASTECSLKAHVRIHSTEPPHVCPDCGKDFSTADSLRKHLEEVCFHLAKNVKYRCPGKRCSKLFTTVTNFSAHFKQHVRCLYTCDVCSSVLFSAKDLEEHVVFHSGNCTFLRLNECTVCNNFGPITEAELGEHIRMHIVNDSISIYVFLCKHCRSFFRSTATFATHLLKCATRMFAGSCSIGNKQKVVVTKKYFCILCNEQIPLEKKVSHMRLCKYANPVVCVEQLNGCMVDLYKIPDDYVCREAPRKSKCAESPDNARKKRKRYLTDISRRRRPEMEPDLIADEPMEFDGTYHCKFCDYQNKQRGVFHRHIRNHRTISTAYQCMECGECFVVKPSLIKHLLHFHNILDYESYLTDNDCFDVDAVKELKSMMKLAPGECKIRVKENQCSVCLNQFESPDVLNKHFRTHGMAFLLKNSK